MPFYHKMGEIPHKRHTQFRKPDGSLYWEQVMGTRGFSGIQSILYHHHPPTQVSRVEHQAKVERRYEEQGALRHRHFATKEAASGGDFLEARRILMGNEDVAIGIARPTEQMNYFYRNGEEDELLFVHEGSGKVETVFGTLTFRKGDYIVIPTGTTYRIVLDDPRETVPRFLVVESRSPIETPRRYRNEHGQLLEHSPFCERDFRLPEKLETHVEEGEFEVRVKAREQLTSFFFRFHPLDVVGWDGYLYPYIFNIEDFEPITGRIHQPPPVHQTFQGANFVVCSFVPRLFDYHPEAIPAPYHHSNVDSDEVLYYVEGNFMSRKGIDEASFTLHPSGLPHGPHPGTVEASIGAKETLELAVMIDTFRPLRVTEEARTCEDDGYMYSWDPQRKE
ncbi:MAG: homogentisate 1,2-dioxygenase [Bacillaceae bacterium]|nr:homogentisate 1,2-dioxygenase [Bacillaceae bacterium]